MFRNLKKERKINVTRKSVVDIKEANGNELDCACGIFVNTEGLAEVVGYGSKRDMLNCICNLVAEIVDNTKDADVPPEDHARAVLKTIGLAVDRKLGIKNDLEENLGKLEELLKKIAE